MILPGYSGTSYLAGARAGVNFGWDLFFGTQGRAVARNIFLDGNTFQNSRSVSKEPVVADLIIGAELFSVRTFALVFHLFSEPRSFPDSAAWTISAAFMTRMFFDRARRSLKS
jgi:hypothetical protein